MIWYLYSDGTWHLHDSYPSARDAAALDGLSVLGSQTEAPRVEVELELLAALTALRGRGTHAEKDEAIDAIIESAGAAVGAPARTAGRLGDP